MPKRASRFYNSPVYYVAIGAFIMFSFACAFLTSDVLPRWRFLTNRGGSMLPLIHPNDLVLVQQERDDLYEPGDVIAYVSLLEGREEIVTHRIVRRGGNAYQTKGDANQIADQEVIVPRRIIGRLILIIPLLGWLIKLVKTPMGSIVFFLTPAALFITCELIRISQLLKSKPTKKQKRSAI